MLGPRRSPPVPCPASNTHTAISILTSVGFRQLESEDYVDAIRKVRPDIVLGMADLVLGQQAGLKRVERMGDRTAVWTQEMVTGIADVEESTADAHQPAFFAPILPVEREVQSMYLDRLQDEWKDHVQGLTVYNASSVGIIPESLFDLPRLSLDEPNSPQEILCNVSLGMDVLTIPFIGAATDSGIALDYVFPCPPASQQESPRSLGLDMWSAEYALDLSPLRCGCPCYTCLKHHRAYIQHLLSAKEMLGWVLLQIHNYQVVDEFFAGIRSSINNGTYEKDKQMFEKVHEREMPEKTGQGPRCVISQRVIRAIANSRERVRGYQFKSNGPGEPRKNQLAYQCLDDGAEKLADVPLPSPSVDAGGLEKRGFAETAN